MGASFLFEKAASSKTYDVFAAQSAFAHDVETLVTTGCILKAIQFSISIQEALSATHDYISGNDFWSVLVMPKLD